MPQTIKLAHIDAADRLRPVNPDHVALIAASIETKGGGVKGNGLDTPFKVRPDGAGGWTLVTGGHRHAALVALGWDESDMVRIDRAQTAVGVDIGKL